MIIKANLILNTCSNSGTYVQTAETTRFTLAGKSGKLCVYVPFLCKESLKFIESYIWDFDEAILFDSFLLCVWLVLGVGVRRAHSKRQVRRRALFEPIKNNQHH